MDMNNSLILKLEIEIDKDILEKNGYNFTNSVQIICDGLQQAGLVKELVEEGHIIYRGTGSNKDFAYIGLIYKSLMKQQWFKDCCKKMDLWKEDKSNPGNFLYFGNAIESAKKSGKW